MYLFTRSVRMGAGRVGDQMAWCLSLTEKVNQITELDVGLWTTVFSPGLGTMVWTAGAEDLEQLELTDTKLMTDSGYLNLLDEGAQFLANEPVNDGLIQIIHAGNGVDTSHAQYASVVESALAPGQTVTGIEVGVEIAVLASAITSASTSFGAAVSGQYGGVTWVTMHDSVQALQRANEAIASDPAFAELIDRKGSTAFVAAMTTQSMYRRIV